MTFPIPWIRKHIPFHLERALYSFLSCLPHIQTNHRGILEDGKSTQTCVTVSSSSKEGLKKTSSGTQCGKPNVYSTGTKTQKQKSVCRTTEAKRDSKRIPKKEVTINLSKNIRQMDTDGRITENCVN
ncbi:brain and acute leukemia cytoplasmic protein isoform X2 [Aquarana catesbeiana]|uniref:brain and acute leukemia cytoplasmic protein isoform X2 n=1 Tax=Aquarana catesbeiana TaxID=8400 RepID=UPI003CCA417C